MSDSNLPCPLCRSPLEIRKSVKSKPYTVCDRCGMQMFIRKDTGIAALKRLLAGEAVPTNPEAQKLGEKVRSLEKNLAQEKESSTEAKKQLSEAKNELKSLEENDSRLASNLRNAKQELTELKKFVYRTCPECNEEFRIREDLIETSWFDGKFRGYRRPNANCGGIVHP